MLETLKTNTKLQKRLAVGAGIFFVAWAIAHIAVAVIAACFLTGMAIYNDKQEALRIKRAAGDLDQIDALARELAAKKAKHQKEKKNKKKKQQQQQHQAPTQKGGGKGNRQGNKGGKGGSHKKAEDPNLACLVKGHVHGISSIAISDDAKLLATASSDAIRVFDAPGLLAKPAAYTYHRIALGGDLASSLSISNCGAYIIYAGRASRAVHIWEFRPFTKDHKVGRKPQEMMVFPTDHKTTIDFALFVTSGARPFIVTASADQADTSVRLWTKKGKSLTRFDTRRAKINAVSVSAEGKFIAVASWTSQVALYEVCRDKDHVFQKVTPAMVFKGHAGQVLDVCFGSFPNGFHNAVSCSMKGELHIWDTDVHYELKQDPRLLAKLPACAGVRYVAVDSAMRTLAALTPTTLFLYRLDVGGTAGALLREIPMPNPGGILAPKKVFFVPSMPFVGTLFEDCKHCHIWKVPQP